MTNEQEAEFARLPVWAQVVLHAGAWGIALAALYLVGVCMTQHAH